MFSRENHRAKTSFASGARPLPRVEFGGVEDFRSLAAVAPFLVGKRGRTEVQEERTFIALPRQLSGTRHGTGDGRPELAPLREQESGGCKRAGTCTKCRCDELATGDQLRTRMSVDGPAADEGIL